MQTIKACVNRRLLNKADRLFTGTVEGRIIEILQNARRAGATKVTVVNQDGWVTVKDNGQGIDDFAKLLDLGGSGWEDQLEQSEDPAGVGIFCLAPREVTIRSNGKIVAITKDGWTHQPVQVLNDPTPVKSGTILRFQDEPWEPSKVDGHAVFSGLQVVVDGKRCPKLPFVSNNATHHAELGCTIEVRESHQLDQWHNSCKREHWYSNNGLVSFHGQVVAFDYHPVSQSGLHYLVDLTGEPTGIRLMLPARTRLVENEAYKQLLAAIELEAYRYIQRRGEHALPYKEFLRAKELGITLPEAKPTFTVGLLSSGDSPEPVEVNKPEDWPLEKCYRLAPDADDGIQDVNAHLLAALGQLASPFVPVSIRSSYDGYSWANLPTIKRVKVVAGRQLAESWIWSGKLNCVESLVVTACTSDGRVFSSPVCLAKLPPPKAKGKSGWYEDQITVTPIAAESLVPSQVWFHLGGWSEDGDTYSTQEYQFEEELQAFWDRLVGPDEQLRRAIFKATRDLPQKWAAVTIRPDGTVTIQRRDKRRVLRPQSGTVGQVGRRRKAS